MAYRCLVYFLFIATNARWKNVKVFPQVSLDNLECSGAEEQKRGTQFHASSRFALRLRVLAVFELRGGRTEALLDQVRQFGEFSRVF